MALDRLIPNSTTPGSIAGDTFMDAVQEELSGLWDRSSIKLTAVGGTANAVTATATPALTGAYADGMMFSIVPAVDNTGAMTLQIGTGAASAVVDRDGTALGAGQFKTGRRMLLLYDSGTAKFHIIGDSSLASTAVKLDFQTFSASGTWTKPGGYSANAPVFVQVWGGGGGGSNQSNGGGGGGGGFCSKVFRLADLGATEAVTIGAGGTAAATGVVGGTSSFDILTAFGGGGGALGGGGGGTALLAGLSAVSTAGGTGGNPAGGAGGANTVAGGSSSGFGGGGGGGGSAPGGLSGFGGGGGGGGGSTPGNGGGSIYGGGGGGGANGTGGAAIGGTSLFGGNGGAVNAAGSAPGGGGGRNASGAAGRCDVWLLG